MLEIQYRARVEEPEAIVIPAPSVPQRVLPPSAMTKGFPRSPKAAWKDALAMPGARVAMSYSRGPWLSRNFQRILEADVQTLVLWVIRADGERLRATWLDRNGWSLDTIWVSGPARQITSKEMKTWMT